MYPLRLSQLRSILIRNLDTRTTTQPSCSVVDCFCELRVLDPFNPATGTSTKTTVHKSHQCKETLNPRWFLPQEETTRLELATVQQFSLHVFSTPSTELMSSTIDVLELVPLNASYKSLQYHPNLPLNTLLFEACGGAIYAHPTVVHLLTDKIAMSRVPALTVLKQLLTSSFALRELRKAYAYQRTTDDYRRTAEHAREDVVIISRKEANDKAVKEELKLIMRSIGVQNQNKQLDMEEKKLKGWERKIDRYEALVYDRAQHVQTIAGHLQQQEAQKQQQQQQQQQQQHNGTAAGRGSKNHNSSTPPTTIYELTTIYPIEKIQLEASGHATALRYQRGTSGGNRNGHPARNGVGSKERMRRTSAFEDDLNDQLLDNRPSSHKSLTSMSSTTSMTLSSVPPQIVQSKALKNVKVKATSSMNQIMSIRGLVLPRLVVTDKNEEEKVRPNRPSLPCCSIYVVVVVFLIVSIHDFLFLFRSPLHLVTLHIWYI
jgi:hypothetical protein